MMTRIFLIQHRVHFTVNYPVISLLILLAVCFAKPAHSDMIFEAGIHHGGAELIQNTYSDGRLGSISAGEMFSFAFGPLFHMSPRWGLQTTIGAKTDADYATDADVKWVRYPFNAILFYSGDSYRIGLGATYHLSPSLKGSGVASNVSQEYKDAAGQIIEIDFRRTSRFLWGIRFTRVEYESAQGNNVIDGNSVGLLIITQM